MFPNVNERPVPTSGLALFLGLALSICHLCLRTLIAAPQNPTFRECNLHRHGVQNDEGGFRTDSGAVARFVRTSAAQGKPRRAKEKIPLAESELSVASTESTTHGHLKRANETKCLVAAGQGPKGDRPRAQAGKDLTSFGSAFDIGG
ncbi:hypothetical protein QBC43DRAFT_365406 [Cladorrhinum sp. PSN259]|nr:hypothetical protein QBC43DRAFT_365406 [Cladorrhinum sp. PSN259]